MRSLVRPRRRFRVATKRFRTLPSFLIIGAQRAGTTSLFEYLRSHQEVGGPTCGSDAAPWAKELHFFDDRFPRGLDWYRSSFPTSARQRLARIRGRNLIAGEATPYYIFHPAVPGRIAETLPEVRLIALLRDPVERAYSHYQLMRREGREKLSFEDALDAEEERLAGEEERILADPDYRSRKHRNFSYAARGLYADQIERWLAYFPREQLLVLRAEDFLARPAAVYAEVLAFLGLPPCGLKEAPLFNRLPYTAIEPALRARLEERFAEPNARLARLLDQDFGWGPVTSAAEPATR